MAIPEEQEIELRELYYQAFSMSDKQGVFREALKITFQGIFSAPFFSRTAPSSLILFGFLHGADLELGDPGLSGRIRLQLAKEVGFPDDKVTESIQTQLRAMVCSYEAVFGAIE